MSALVSVPSSGRLRDEVLSLLGAAGYRTSMLRSGGARTTLEGIEWIAMRPRDAAAALNAGSLDAAYLATDIVGEHELEDLPALPLGFARSDLVVASRADDGRSAVTDLSGCVVATHLPRTTAKFFADRGVQVTVMELGGSLEGVCAAGLADAIVDLRDTGMSLLSNGLRVLEVLRGCEAMFVHRPGLAELDDLQLRLDSVLAARRHRYVMLHLPPERVDELRELFPGLAAPTFLPLAGRNDLVAVHFVVTTAQLWARLSDLRDLGASGIVALEPQALLE